MKKLRNYIEFVFTVLSFPIVWSFLKILIRNKEITLREFYKYNYKNKIQGKTKEQIIQEEIL